MRRTDSTPFLDLAFCMMFGFVMLFAVAVLQIKEESQKKDIKTYAEYIIALTWQERIDHDVDIWVRDPQENLLFFRSKEVGIMHLDRDDLGNMNDTYEEGGEVKIAPTNQEIVTIRGYMSGEWIINTHFYRVGKNDPDKIARCKITITKLNPSAQIVLNKYFVLEGYWQEKTIARFLMTQQGEFFLQETIPINFVTSKLSMSGTYD